jgi:predicted small metal-binding protein
MLQVMRKFACHDVGVQCPWTIYSDNDEDLVRRAREHVAEEHRAMNVADDEGRIRGALKSA